MVRYLAGRVMQAVAVVLVVTIVVFALLQALPGGAARAILGPRATPSAIAAFNQANYYNRPLPIQYLHWLAELATGNLGFSYKYYQPVASLIATDLPKSLLITVPAVIIALLVAIPMGMYQAAHRDKSGDYILTTASFVLYSMPAFWLGLVLILYLAVDRRVFPAEAPQGATVGQIIQQPQGLVLPILTLSLITLALFSRYMRSSVLDNLHLDYVRTARATGASRARTLIVHVTRNALIPVTTLVGLSLPTIIAGAVVTETVFNYPGMGLLFFRGAQDHDYPVILGVTVVVAVGTVIGSLAADLAYAVLDPRVRYVP
jgi:peptide/nickel transport system permease protein